MLCIKLYQFTLETKVVLGADGAMEAVQQHLALVPCSNLHNNSATKPVV